MSLGDVVGELPGSGAVGKDIFVFGSADLSSHFMPLFDELRVGVAPFFLGSGSPLFKKQKVILRYAPQVDYALQFLRSVGSA